MLGDSHTDVIPTVVSETDRPQRDLIAIDDFRGEVEVGHNASSHETGDLEFAVPWRRGLCERSHATASRQHGDENQSEVRHPELFPLQSGYEPFGSEQQENGNIGLAPQSVRQ
jgi:hypothetical protein